MTNLGKARLYKMYAFLIYAIPMMVLFFANMDEYKSDGSIFGFFGIVILMLVLIAFKNTVLEFVKKRTVLTVSVFVLLFSMLMASFADKMVLIATVSTIGGVFQGIVDVVADTYYNHAYIVKDGIKTRNPEMALTDKEAWAEAYGL